MKLQTTNCKLQNKMFGIWSLIFVICLGFGCLRFEVPTYADGYLSDPMSIGVGARPLGMGKAFVAVAEDGDAIFMNPAGLASSGNPKLTSMYASLMGDVNYEVIGGVYPLGERSAVGAGYIGSSVDSIPLTSSTGASLGTGSWGDNIIFISYATYLSEFGPKFDSDVLVGANLKYFGSSGSGVSGEADSGSGYGLDLGLLIPVNPRLMLGADLQNALSSKITRASGSTDNIQRTLKVGAKIKLLGSDDTAPLAADDSRKLYCAVDYDYNYNAAGVTHVGVEFWPTGSLALRAGLDDKDLTAGLGVRVSGLEFNYAYHPYSGINEDTTSYFSIGYLGEARQREIRVMIDEPKDKSVIYEDHVTVKGKVEIKDGNAPKSPLSLKVNGSSVAVSADGSFVAEAPVDNYGKKLVRIEASDSSGNTAVGEARVLRLTSFADVPEGYWAKQPIENNATVGLVQGYPDGNFKPDRPLSRAELATLLVRAKGFQLPEGQARRAFKDVKPDFWAAKYIEVAQREGLINGYPDRTFRPNNSVNKAEGIAIMVRFDQLELAQVDSQPYWDVPADHWAAKYIESAKEAGMLSFIENNRLQPKAAMVRSESVELLGKTSLANSKIKDLYSWEKGFKPGLEQRPTIKAGLDTFANK